MSLTLLLFWMIDITVGLLPGGEISKRDMRVQIANNLAVQVAQLMDASQQDLLAKTLSEMDKLNHNISAIRLLSPAGTTIAESHVEETRPVQVLASSDTRSDTIAIPIYRGDEHQATISIDFSIQAPISQRFAWVTPGVITPTLIIVFGSLFFYLYLRRVLQHMDPSKVIPGRVSSALNTLTEGVVIVDLNGRLMLTNTAFSKLHPDAEDNTLGVKINEIPWLDHEDQPWDKVLSKQTRQAKAHFDISLPCEQGDCGEEALCKVIINASAVADDDGQLKGCLITFQDVTEQEKTNSRLRKTLSELYRTQQEIEEKNKELTQLASYDQLTGLLNRRAFFEQAEELFSQHKASLTPLVCIMCDIDHFKRVNDGYGHAVGDEAIKIVSRFLQNTVRPGDIVGRYGGEEFCIILPNVDEVSGGHIAERIRKKIYQLAGKGIRSVPNLQITCSFGLAPLDHSCDSLSTLIDEADQALYLSKENGRNQITVYQDKKTVLL